MLFYLTKIKYYFLLVIVLSFFSTSCVAVAVGAAVAGVAGVAVVGGTVSELDKTEIALAVEKGIYAIEKEKGVVTELSFADGYVKGKVGEYDVVINVYVEDNGILSVSVRVSKYLISNVELAEKILNNYRNFKK